MLPPAVAPSFHADANHARKAALRHRVTNSEVTKLTTATVWQTDPKERHVRMALGSDRLMEADAVAAVLRMLRDYFAPGALNMVNQDLARSPQLQRVAQMMDEYLAEFDFCAVKRNPGCRLGAGVFP